LNKSTQTTTNTAYRWYSFSIHQASAFHLSVVGRSNYRPVWQWLRRSVFTYVGGQVTLCDLTCHSIYDTNM